MARNGELSELALVGGAQVHLSFWLDVRLVAVHVSLTQRFFLIVGLVCRTTLKRSIGGKSCTVRTTTLPLWLVWPGEIALLGCLGIEFDSRLCPQLTLSRAPGWQLMLFKGISVASGIHEWSVWSAPLFLTSVRLPGAQRVLREVLLTGGAALELFPRRHPFVDLTPVTGRQAPLPELSCGQNRQSRARRSTGRGSNGK